jgi:TM2 domain-containing membrane protein YozV
MMKEALKHFPELDGEELQYVSKSIEGLSEEELDLFKSIYKARRKDPVIFMIMILLGLVGVAGVHRIFIGQIGIGILYFFTGGLCLIGTIVDLINYKSLSFEYNRTIVIDALNQIR